MAKSALGKGLGALIAARPPVARIEPAPDSGERIQQLSLTSISASPFQPRKEFEHEALQELVDSIREHGIIQPLIVRLATASSSDGGQVGVGYELIAGERRLRAARELGLEKVPAIVRSANDLEVLELSLIENLQRADLNAIEEAQAYARLAGEFSMRQEDIAQKVGRSRAAVANSMRLLDLHPQIQTWVTQDLISVGHAKVLLASQVRGRTVTCGGDGFATKRDRASDGATRCTSIGKRAHATAAAWCRWRRAIRRDRRFAESASAISRHARRVASRRKARSDRDRVLRQRRSSAHPFGDRLAHGRCLRVSGCEMSDAGWQRCHPERSEGPLE